MVWRGAEEGQPGLPLKSPSPTSGAPGLRSVCRDRTPFSQPLLSPCRVPEAGLLWGCSPGLLGERSWADGFRWEKTGLK